MNVYTKLVRSVALCLLYLSHCMPIVSVSFIESEGKAADGNAPENQSHRTETLKAEKAFENDRAVENQHTADNHNKNDQGQQTLPSKQVTAIDFNSNVDTHGYDEGVDLTSFAQDVTVQAVSEPLFPDGSTKSTESTKSTMQKPDDSIAQVMQESLPQGQKVMTMGRREDGSHYMVSGKVKEKVEDGSVKVKTIQILEFDAHGKPLQDENGVIESTILDIDAYKNELTASRQILLQKAQQELAEFKKPENLEKQAEAYKKQQDAYNKAIATRDNLELMAQTDLSVQDAYQQAEKNLDILRQEISLEDPADVMKRMENTVIKYSDKTTKVSIAKKNLDEARQIAIDTNNKITTLQEAYDNEKDPVKRSQISNELQGAKNSKIFIDQNVKDVAAKLERAKKSSDAVEQKDFGSIFDDITLQFVKDPDVMESLLHNEDYKIYKNQVTQEVYAPTTFESIKSQAARATNVIYQTSTFMADVDLGKAFKVKTPNPSKLFKSLAQDAKYAFKNVKEKINQS